MFSGYIIWHYGAGFRTALAIAGNFLAFAIHLFSMRELASSIFAPWRRISDATSSFGLMSSQMLWTIWDNTMSRILGAIARLILLALGTIFFVAVALVAFAVLVIWIIGPLLPPTLLFLGFFLLI